MSACFNSLSTDQKQPPFISIIRKKFLIIDLIIGQTDNRSTYNIQDMHTCTYMQHLLLLVILILDYI